LKDQLLYLQQLQDIDLKTKEIRENIELVPAQLDPAKKDLAMLEGMLELERTKLKETEAWRAEQEEIVTREEEALKNAKAKLQEAKNARDFGAASREIDNKKRSIHDREQEILKVYEALEIGKSKLEAHEADVEKLRAHVDGEQAKFADVLKELERQAVEVVAGRDEIVAKINDDLMKRYNAVVQRRGNAVVAVKSGVCQGCHMALAPQLAIQVARAESIHACRQCKRLLYVPEVPEEGGAESEAAS
jgi:predicted  nucleic acid-binding Zn-ribbon protein